ncbi:MAG: hypothetical protein R2706_19275 [Acidimicrobiales bacterium]
MMCHYLGRIQQGPQERFVCGDALDRETVEGDPALARRSPRSSLGLNTISLANNESKLGDVV